MEIQTAQNLAEYITNLLQDNVKENDDRLRSTLEKINQRLERIESQVSVETSNFKIQNSNSPHSSQEKFGSLQDLAAEMTNNFELEKACPYEPTGKPCDYCAMCSSRGF